MLQSNNISRLRSWNEAGDDSCIRQRKKARLELCSNDSNVDKKKKKIEKSYLKAIAMLYSDVGGGERDQVIAANNDMFSNENLRRIQCDLISDRYEEAFDAIENLIDRVEDEEHLDEQLDDDDDEIDFLYENRRLCLQQMGQWDELYSEISHDFEQQDRRHSTKRNLVGLYVESSSKLVDNDETLRKS